MHAKYWLMLLFICNLAFGLYLQSTFIVEDAAIHSMMVQLIRHNGLMPATYEPVSDTRLTYPLLFHVLASAIPLRPIDAVRLLGLLSYALLPLCFYLAAKAFTRQPLIPALLSVLLVNLAYLVAYSAFPQILAFDLFLLYISSFMAGKRIMAGVLAGLVILTHPFMGFIAGVFLVIGLAYRAYNTFLVAAIIAVPCSPMYLSRVQNILANTWNNAKWAAIQGTGIESNALSFLVFRLNIIIVIAASIGFIHFMKSRKDRLFVAVLLLLPFAFTIFHLAQTQYKFLDFLSIPVLLLSGTGIEYAGRRVGKRLVPLALVALCIFSISLHAIYPQSPVRMHISAFDSRYYPAAEWLAANRPDFSRIMLLDITSIDKNASGYTSELVFSQLACKYPMDGALSDLEAYSPNYKQQLLDRQAILSGNESTLEKYNIRHTVGDRCLGRIIYDSDSVRICERIP